MRPILSILTIIFLFVSCNSKQEAQERINNNVEIEFNNDVDYIGY